MEATRNEKLYRKRIERGLGQQEVADAIGTTVQYYSMIENGKRTPRYELMKKIADYFKVKPDYFFYEYT